MFRSLFDDAASGSLTGLKGLPRFVFYLQKKGGDLPMPAVSPPQLAP
jgi:hypothetical protein